MDDRPERRIERDVSYQDDASELRRMVGELTRRFEAAVDRLDGETARLAEQTARLTALAERLEAQLPAPRAATAAEAPVQTPVASGGDPRFSPDNGGVDLVLTQVPDFQGLMQAHRALNDLPSQASVVAFKNGQASLKVHLRTPVSAQEIVDGLRAATGYRLLIEESRPEAQRLRLRFLENGG
jgi:hypothetical protein